jgi:hypothetical protein
MKLFIAIVLTGLSFVLFTGCQTPEEAEQHVEQRQYDAIVKQGQETIQKNQEKINLQEH